MSSPTYTIERGRAFMFEGSRIRYTGRARDLRGAYLFVRDDGIQVTFEPAALATARESNLLSDWVETRKFGDNPETRPVVWLNANEWERARAERRLDYCMTWAERPQTPRSETGLRPLIVEVHARRKAEAEAAQRFEPPAPCPSSVRKWIAEWEAKDRVADGLITSERYRGNRSNRFPTQLAEVLADCVDQHYLSDKRLSAAQVHRELTKIVGKLNRTAVHPLATPSYDAVLDAVSRLCPFTTDFCRRGALYAREKWRAVSAGYITEFPNEVWEMDDTRLDLICTAEDGTVIGRPWIIVVIDRHTRMIMSFVISFHPPDTSAAMEALRRAILSKDAVLAKYNLQAFKYPASGRPDFIHVDNAKQYNSVGLKRGLAQLGIQHRTMPVLKAWYRAIVERAIGTLTRQVFHVVPGTTYSGIYERDNETPPESVAETTLAEAEAKLWRWLVTEYTRRKHKGLEDTPLAVWNCYFSDPKHEMRLPLPSETVDAALSLTVARKARKEGLQFSMLVYISDDLLDLLLLPKAVIRDEVVIRIDRNNLEAIDWLNPVTNEWRRAVLRQDLVARVRGRSLEEYEIARATRRNRPGEYEDDPDWVRTYSENEAMREAAAQDRRLASRVRAAGELERLRKTATRLTTPKVEHPLQTDDVSSLLDRMAQNQHGPAQLPAEAASDDFDPEQWAVEQGLAATGNGPDRKP